MRVNLMTIGQTVQVRFGRYAGRIGYIQRLYTLADTHRVCYKARVRMTHGAGRRDYPVDALQVVGHEIVVDIPQD
jgi:hypothetical protein